MHYTTRSNLQRVLVSIAALGILAACNVAERDWETAHQAGTLEAYRGFLDKHPDSEYAGQAMSFVEQLEFEQVRDADVIAAYEAFLERFSDSDHAGEARSRLEELRFEQARSADTIHAYEDFLSNHSEGKLAESARGRIAVLSMPTYTEVLETYPKSAVLCGTRADLLAVESDSTLIQGLFEATGGEFGIGIERGSVQRKGTGKTGGPLFQTLEGGVLRLGPLSERTDTRIEFPFQCYGTRITVKKSVRMAGVTFDAGTKLTVDGDLKWVAVSSWV